MNDGANARQQIVEKIRQSANILVTVGSNPSVDELSAALGLTAMINGLNKHATAVVSGTIPPAIEFLEPGKTFENTVDSLRDFIIALDKEKADHLRYKVEGDVVKIFITPYRTTISQDDLDFSQGDYNVELVLALGVESEDQLDKALESHGRILHDATVATISNKAASKLGSIDWYDQNGSSISEMLVSLSESLKTDKPLLDEQIATAFLTGIVASTDRFSNNKTSSKVMTMAAQLMAAGANQQLIAAKLEDAHEISSDAGNTPNTDGTTELSEGESRKVQKDSSKKKPSKEKDANDGTLSIAHEAQGSLDEVAEEVREKQGKEAAEKAEDALAEQLESVAPAAASTATPSVADLQQDIAAASAEVTEAAQSDPIAPATDSSMPGYEPTLGGTLNATTEQAADDKRKEVENDQNKTILSHGVPSLPKNGGPVFAASPFNAAGQDDHTASVSPQSQAPADAVTPSSLPPLPPIDFTPAPVQTLADIDQANRGSDPNNHGDALAAVHAAIDETTQSSTTATTDTLQPPADNAFTVPSVPNLPPLPDFSTLPPVPGSQTTDPTPFTPPVSASEPEQLGQIFPETPNTQPQQPQSNDPGQFKIPGQ